MRLRTEEVRFEKTQYSVDKADTYKTDSYKTKVSVQHVHRYDSQIHENRLLRSGDAHT